MNIQMLFGVFLTQGSSIKQGLFSSSTRFSRKQAALSRIHLSSEGSAEEAAKRKPAELDKVEGGNQAREYHERKRGRKGRCELWLVNSN